MANRKLISWRIDNLDQREQDEINAWLDQQQNIQKSITNVVQHMINRFGHTDIMSYNNQRALYTDTENTVGVLVDPVVNQTSKEVIEPVVEEKIIQQSEVKKDVQKITDVEDIYKDLDI